ncbi:tetratricopeptide repeat-containing sensor histidine kinase [Flavihumibacter profundi]|uniref:tetratricopeptide repeat-containing sensor histidine kinase n=1 Tax=Flavihumibacter profundi TaxID=2716883 RepID=UPI001CC5BD7A|nr:histidine kinase [Flavihumibacter profundi]MBZ5857172.1 histidine kinase [Flavihumibacter profundi]
MKKIFLITVWLSCFILQGYSQVTNAFKTDSTRLDSLKRTLPAAKGSDRVDLMNSIAGKTLLNAGGSPRKRIDTCLFYSGIAYKEAEKLGYKKGMAIALLSLAGVEAGMNQPVKDEATKVKDMRKALTIAQELNDYKLLGMAYAALAYMPSVRKDFNLHVDYYKKAIDYFLKAGDTLNAAEISNWFTGDYEERGEYEQAFDYAKQSVDLSKKAGTDFSMNWKQFLVQFSLESMAELYSFAGDYATAMSYIKENARYGKENNTDWDNMDLDIANLFSKMGKYDSAMAYVNRVDTNSPPGLFPGRKAALAQIYLNGTKEYEKAIPLFQSCSDTVRKYFPDSVYATARYSIYIGQAYDGLKNYPVALKYAKEGVGLAEEKQQRPILMDGYQVLSSIYHHLGKNDSAYACLMKFNAIKDSIQNKQFLLRIYNSKKDAEDEKKKAQIGLLMKDNKIKQQQLKEESLMKNFLFVFLIALVLTGIFIFRTLTLKRKNDRLQNSKQQAELQEKATRLEMQALRAQMNPHFIFNCLSSINCFILENETEKASDYLTRFSRLIRMVLNNSEKSLISLDEELKMLKLYLDMERLRFENSFDYNITYTNDVDADTALVPPLLLQPFCENAIWHGLMNKEGQGHLNITIKKENEYLNCIITDDGIGRAKARALNTGSAKKEKSMGLKITTERLSLFNQDKDLHSFYEIDDIIDSNGLMTGTKVSIKIRHKNIMEAVA